MSRFVRLKRLTVALLAAFLGGVVAVAYGVPFLSGAIGTFALAVILMSGRGSFEDDEDAENGAGQDRGQTTGPDGGLAILIAVVAAGAVVVALSDHIGATSTIFSAVAIVILATGTLAALVVEVPKRTWKGRVAGVTLAFGAWGGAFAAAWFRSSPPRRWVATTELRVEIVEVVRFPWWVDAIGYLAVLAVALGVVVVEIGPRRF